VYWATFLPSFSNMTDYMAFIVQGLFTGIGTATGLWVYDKYVKPKLEKGHEHIQKIGKIKVL
jgi:hypothetical protein